MHFQSENKNNLNPNHLMDWTSSNLETKETILQFLKKMHDNLLKWIKENDLFYCINELSQTL